MEAGLEETPDTTDSDSVFDTSGTEVWGVWPIPIFGIESYLIIKVHCVYKCTHVNAQCTCTCTCTHVTDVYVHVHVLYIHCILVIHCFLECHCTCSCIHVCVYMYMYIQLYMYNVCVYLCVHRVMLLLPG